MDKLWAFYVCWFFIDMRLSTDRTAIEQQSHRNQEESNSNQENKITTHFFHPELAFYCLGLESTPFYLNNTYLLSWFANTTNSKPNNYYYYYYYHTNGHIIHTFMKTPFKPDRSIFSLAPSKPQKPQARTKFDYKLSCSLRLQLSLKKLILLHIENIKSNRWNACSFRS